MAFFVDYQTLTRINPLLAAIKPAFLKKNGKKIF